VFRQAFKFAYRHSFRSGRGLIAFFRYLPDGFRVYKEVGTTEECYLTDVEQALYADAQHIEEEAHKAEVYRERGVK